MIPSAEQFRRWALPTRWTFMASVAAMIGLALAGAGLWVSVTGPARERTVQIAEERRELVFLASQELRQNSELLSQLATLDAVETVAVGQSAYSASSLKLLASEHYSEVTKHAYGEEKYIYQEILKLERWLGAISNVGTSRAAADWNQNSEFTVQDVLFLNDFLWWYLHPMIEEELSGTQKRALGWEPYPKDSFRVPIGQRQSKQFMVDGQPISEFVDYLSYLD